MPTGADGVLTAVWRPEAAAVSLEVDGAGWGAGVRTNLAHDPRATTSGNVAGQARWTPRWFGGSGGAGTTTAISGASDGPLPGVSTYLRKTWTVTGGVSETGFDHTIGAYSSPATSTAGMPVAVGRTYTLSSYMRASSVPTGTQATTFSMRAVFRDAAGARILPAPVATSVTPVAGQWVRVSLTVTAPAGAVTVSVGSDVSGNGTWPVGATLDGTGLLVEEASSLGTYFDGATVPSGSRPDAIAAWTGTPNASPSTLTAAPITDIRIMRYVAGQPDVPVRGADRVPAVDGYWAGSDHEQPLGSSVTYQAIGYTAAGATVLSSMVTVSTEGAPHGVWLKAAGRPNLTTRLGLVEVGELGSATQGGVYNIVGGRGIAVAAAAGREGDTLSLTVRAASVADLEAVDALLDEQRVLLIQPIAHVRPFKPGWWFVSAVSTSLEAQVDRSDSWLITLSLTRTGVPAGGGQGVIGWSYAAVAATYASYAVLKAARSDYFNLVRGA